MALSIACAVSAALGLLVGFLAARYIFMKREGQITDSFHAVCRGQLDTIQSYKKEQAKIGEEMQKLQGAVEALMSGRGAKVVIEPSERPKELPEGVTDINEWKQSKAAHIDTFMPPPKRAA